MFSNETPLDYFLFHYVKFLSYSDKLSTFEALEPDIQPTLTLLPKLLLKVLRS